MASLVIKDMAQTINIIWEQVYFRLGKEEVCFPKLLVYHNYVLQVFLKWIQENEYIVKTYMYETSDEVSESNSYKPLECGWGIIATHLYDTIIVENMVLYTYSGLMQVCS